MDKATKKVPLIFFVIVLHLALSSPLYSHGASAQSLEPFNIVNDAEIEVDLSAEEDGLIRLRGNFTNTREESLQNLEFRFDLRHAVFHSAKVGNENVTGTLQPADRYTILRLTTQQPIESQESKIVEIELSSSVLEENVGLGDNGTLELYQMIYYLRPVNEYRNLTFLLALRRHAILVSEQTTPLFPKPDANYTDGTSMGFTWKIERIFPSQERVFIVKFGVPVTIRMGSSDSVYWPLFLLLAGFGGATAVLILQRIPEFIRSFQPQVYSVNGSTKHEEQILRLIAKKDGTCPQRVIYEELDLSQSMVSMILTGLEERGVVKRFKEGRENIVHLIENP
ncbi:hypothetical protein EU537_00360 [Candidatus Thorarchaeota archaeon]|nr:MAG: hypothetical protein EU537_00360 [Candidatus Thorarchaeota archaeon]